MTKAELNFHRDCILMAKKGRIVIMDLQARAEPASPNTDGMPHASGVSDKVSDLAILLAEAEAEQERLDRAADRSRQAVIAFTRTIQDPYIRHLFNLRYIGCEDWEDVAGDTSTAESVKKICSRYLDRLEDQE